jgi:hypothetical protein
VGRVVVRVLIAGYLLGLALVAFWPTPVDRAARGTIARAVTFLQSHGLPWLEYAHVEWGANVVLYVPFGVLGVLLLRRWWLVALLGIVVSIGVELGQRFLLPERFSSPADVAANGLGTLLGVAVAAVVVRLSGRGTSNDRGRSDGRRSPRG